MTRLWGRAAVLLLAGLVCACASDQDDQGLPRGRRGGGGDAGGPPPSGDAPVILPRMFISPTGEPFRPHVGAPEPLRVWFDQADTNHDGILTPAEFLADHVRFFNILDANHDGSIDDAEVTLYEERIAPEILTANDRPELDQRQAPSQSGGGRGGRGGGRGGGGGGRGGRGGGNSGLTTGGGAAPKGGEDLEGAARYGLINEPEPIRAADSNFDFVISAGEWQAASTRRFNLLDTKHDGKITFDELKLLQGGGRPKPPRKGAPSNGSTPPPPPTS